MTPSKIGYGVAHVKGGVFGCRRKMRMSGLCKVEMSAFMDGRGVHGDGANGLASTRTGPHTSVARGEAGTRKPGEAAKPSWSAGGNRTATGWLALAAFPRPLNTMCLPITLGGNLGGGQFYLAQTRTFLLCVARVESSGRAGLRSITNYECGETQWQNQCQHENDPCRAARKIDRVPDADALFDKERRIVRIEIEKPKLPT
jgi:hypothetical protein